MPQGSGARREAAMSPRRALALLAVAVLVAGCTGHDDADTTSSSATNSEPTTSGPDTATSPPTSNVESTASSTPPTSTAASSTTTTLPADEQVRAAMLAYYDFYWRCLRAPEQCDPSE